MLLNSWLALVRYPEKGVRHQRDALAKSTDDAARVHPFFDVTN